jgi:hypothetical protein
VPNADFQAQVETGTGHAGEIPPPEPGDVGSGGGQFNPDIQIDTSNTSIAPMPRDSARHMTSPNRADSAVISYWSVDR